MTVNDATCVAIGHLQDVMHKQPSGNPCTDCAHDRGETCAAGRIPYVCKTQGRPDEPGAISDVVRGSDLRANAMHEAVVAEISGKLQEEVAGG